MPNCEEIAERFAKIDYRFRIWMAQVTAVLQHDPVIETCVQPVAINARIKETRSLMGKVDRKHDDFARPISSSNFTEEFSDLAGVRLIVPSKTSLPTAIKRIEQLQVDGYWNIDDVVMTIWHPSERKLMDLAPDDDRPDDARYVGRHFILEPPSPLGDETIRVACELQVRTLLEEGIFSVYHRLAYKKNVPRHITDQLNVAVEMVEVLDEGIRLIEQGVSELPREGDEPRKAV